MDHQRGVLLALSCSVPLGSWGCDSHSEQPQLNPRGAAATWPSSFRLGSFNRRHWGLSLIPNPPLLLSAPLSAFLCAETRRDVSGQYRESIKGGSESLGGGCLQQQRRRNYCNNCPTNHSQETPLNLIECEGRLETQDPLLHPPLP